MVNPAATQDQKAPNGPEPAIVRSSEAAPSAPSTAGMTTKVVKGSLWTLAGQVAPLAVSLVATPLAIRMLGAESYGVLILVGLIPSYLGFADIGMSLASTKFGSEAYAAGDPQREAQVVRTAAAIALCGALPAALLIALFSSQLATIFNVPDHLHWEASLALKIAAATLVVTFLNGIFNTPQLARLRMDLNTFVNSGFRMAGIIATPIVLYMGGGILGAVVVLFIAALLTLLGHLYTSSRLLSRLFEMAIDRNLIRPLTKFGGAMAISAVAGILLVNLEKLVLARTTSIQELAYYSLAFTLATMATMFTQAMIQSLIPAFSQLLAPGKREQLQGLFARSLRLIVIALFPTIVILFVMAQPIFVYLGGEDFGHESTWPFRILLLGLLFNILAFAPYSLMLASGRADLLARIYWAELLPYLFLISFCASRFGASGAAFAWSLRVIVDACIIGWLLFRYLGVSLRIFTRGNGLQFCATTTILLPPLFLVVFHEGTLIGAVSLLALCLVVYSILVWKNFFEDAERAWLGGRIFLVVGK